MSEAFVDRTGAPTAAPIGVVPASTLADGAFGALRPLVAETAAARIADRFVTAIALGQFVVGQKLPTVNELGNLLEVSPSTVREALSRLAALGYVVVNRGRGGGTVVTSNWGPSSGSMVRRALAPGWSQLEVTLDYRSLIEQQIARTAARRITPEDAAGIQAAVKAYEAAPDREASRLADLELHKSITAAAKNPQLAQLGLRIRHDVSLGFEAEPYTPELRATAIRQHEALSDAVVAGDGERAADLAAAHFKLTEETIRSLHARIANETN
ncbi:MAG: FCD domain-containing protein [Actinomycetota bacterium]|nr:FCD domain-containing protein [Actinomycetota bacterium]